LPEVDFMAIEIREIVVKATVNKSTSGSRTDFVTKQELVRIQDKFAQKMLSKVKDLLEEQKSLR